MDKDHHLRNLNQEAMLSVQRFALPFEFYLQQNVFELAEQ